MSSGGHLSRKRKAVYLSLLQWYLDDSGAFDPLEWAFFFDELEPKRNTPARTLHVRLNFNSQIGIDCRRKYRFRHEHLEPLRSALGLPCGPVSFPVSMGGILTSGEELLLLYLRRISYPRLLFDLMVEFDRSEGELSRMFQWTCLFITRKWKHLLKTYLTTMPLEKLQQFSLSTKAKLEEYGCVMARGDMVSIADGCLTYVCRPGGDKSLQRAMFNGKDHTHGALIVTVKTPDGIHAYSTDLLPGANNDKGVCNQVGLDDLLDDMFRRHDSPDFYAVTIADRGFNAGKRFVPPFEVKILSCG